MSGLIEIAPVSSATAEVRALIGELDAELSESYTPEQRHGLALEAIFQPHIRFFVARLRGTAVGCGGVALFSDFAEVKRMYVRKPSRGQGVADAIVARLTMETLRAGLSLLRLEAGAHSLPALRFYRRCGFNPSAIYEPYTAMAPHAIATSVFMEKKLSAPSV